MPDTAALIALLNTELGLVLEPEQARLPLAALPDWDSLLLLQLVGVLEDAYGRRVPVAEILAADTLEQIHTLVARP